MTRLCVAALCSVSLFASAAAPKRGVAIGSSKEDEPCVAKASTAGTDVAFLRGITWAFDPAPLSLDANPAIAKAAVRAIGTIRSPRAEEILANLVRHPTAPLATKQIALGLLPYQNTSTALPVPTPESALPALPATTTPNGAMQPAAFPIGDSK